MWVGRVGETQPLHCPFPLQRRALEIAALFTAEPEDCERIFAQPFIDNVPIPQLKGIFASYYAKLGQCTEVRQTAGETALGTSSGKFDFIFERDFSVPGLVAIDPI